MNKLELLKLAENEDEEAYEVYDFEEKDEDSFKMNYNSFYDDVKQPSKYIEEDW